jgi:hypothetical protein
MRTLMFHWLEIDRSVTIHDALKRAESRGLTVDMVFFDPSTTYPDAELHQSLQPKAQLAFYRTASVMTTQDSVIEEVRSKGLRLAGLLECLTLWHERTSDFASSANLPLQILGERVLAPILAPDPRCFPAFPEYGSRKRRPLELGPLARYVCGITVLVAQP